MLLLVQLTASTPELKLLVPGVAVHASFLTQHLRNHAQEQPGIALGWRMIDRSSSCASPDCMVLADTDDSTPFYQLQPLTALQHTRTHNLKEICVHTGNYILQQDEFVTVLLEIDTMA